MRSSLPLQISRAANRSAAGDIRLYAGGVDLVAQLLEQGRPAAPYVAPGDWAGELAEALELDVLLHLQRRPVADGTHRVMNAAREGLAVLLLLEHARCLGADDPRTHLLLHARAVDVVVARLRPRVPR